MVNYEISSFPISDANIQNFRRWVKKPMDCVINALEIVGIIDQTNADLMRIAVGDFGLNVSQIESIFEYVSALTPSRFSYKFFRYTNLQSLSNICAAMPLNTVIFCGYNKNNFKHVFLIGKTSNSDIIYIDPQYGQLCALNRDPGCLSVIQNAQEYYVLQYADTSMRP